MFKIKYQLLILVLSLSLIFLVCGRDSQVREKAVSPPYQYEYSLDEIAFIKSQVESVSEEDIKSILVDLEQFGTRYSPSQGNLKAAQYITVIQLSVLWRITILRTDFTTHPRIRLRLWT